MSKTLETLENIAVGFGAVVAILGMAYADQRKKEEKKETNDCLFSFNKTTTSSSRKEYKPHKNWEYPYVCNITDAHEWVSMFSNDLYMLHGYTPRSIYRLKDALRDIHSSYYATKEKREAVRAAFKEAKFDLRHHARGLNVDVVPLMVFLDKF